MGVDWYACANCNETFNDHGRYVICGQDSGEGCEDRFGPCCMDSKTIGQKCTVAYIKAQDARAERYERRTQAKYDHEKATIRAELEGTKPPPPIENDGPCDDEEADADAEKAAEGEGEAKDGDKEETFWFCVGCMGGHSAFRAKTHVWEISSHSDDLAQFVCNKFKVKLDDMRCEFSREAFIREIKADKDEEKAAAKEAASSAAAAADPQVGDKRKAASQDTEF